MVSRVRLGAGATAAQVAAALGADLVLDVTKLRLCQDDLDDRVGPTLAPGFDELLAADRAGSEARRVRGGGPGCC